MDHDRSDFAAAHTARATEIPIIDIGAAQDRAGFSRLAKDIHTAATEVGFFYVSGHGINPSLMGRAFQVTRAFFDLPESEKATIAVNSDQRGWMAQGMSTLDGARTHDLKEVFFWGREVATNDPDLRAGKALVAPNQWPDEVFPDLRRGVMPYYDAVCAVALRVMSALAVSLYKPADFFEVAYERPLARGQLVYYPPSTATDEAEERFGVAPHTDFGVMTFLLQDDSGGLQVRRRDGLWIEAPPIPGTLVCNIGDLLQRWSNDRFTSTLHRVINRSGAARYSIPVFFDPHPDTIVDPSDFDIPASSSRYDPISVGAHITRRNRKSFAQYRTSSAGNSD